MMVPMGSKPPWANRLTSDLLADLRRDRRVESHRAVAFRGVRDQADQSPADRRSPVCRL